MSDALLEAEAGYETMQADIALASIAVNRLIESAWQEVRFYSFPIYDADQPVLLHSMDENDPQNCVFRWANQNHEARSVAQNDLGLRIADLDVAYRAINNNDSGVISEFAQIERDWPKEEERTQKIKSDHHRKLAQSGLGLRAIQEWVRLKLKDQPAPGSLSDESLFGVVSVQSSGGLPEYFMIRGFTGTGEHFSILVGTISINRDDDKVVARPCGQFTQTDFEAVAQMVSELTR